MPGGVLLQVRDLCVELPDRAVLKNLSFEIRSGEIVGLRGDSGAGKTTLALALTQLLGPGYRVRGEVRLEQQSLFALSEKQWQAVRGARIAYILQDPMLALNPVLRVRTQLAEVLRAHAVRRDLTELLSLVGFDEPARILAAYPHQLSGGERQRVTIAQALGCRPTLIVADEPFTALDAPRVVALAQLFRKLCDQLQTSFLLISHSPGVLARTADRVIELSGAHAA